MIININARTLYSPHHIISFKWSKTKEDKQATSRIEKKTRNILTIFPGLNTDDILGGKTTTCCKNNSIGSCHKPKKGRWIFEVFGFF